MDWSTRSIANTSIRIVVDGTTTARNPHGIGKLTKRESSEAVGACRDDDIYTARNESFKTERRRRFHNIEYV
jgi:hypothetical protein